MADDYSDEDLMSMFRKGDRAAFEQIFNRYQAKLYLVAFNWVHDREAARDIVVVTLNGVFQNHTKFERLNSLNHYLYLRLRSRCIDHLREKRALRLKETEYTSALESAELVNDQLDADLAARLWTSVDRLPERSKEVIVLFYLHGLKYKEIAEKLNISPNSVENQLRFALKRLKDRLGNEKLYAISLILTVLLSHTSF